MFYGWRYEGNHIGKHVIYFWNGGMIVESKRFDTKDEALDFIAEWQDKVEKLEP